MLARTRWLPWVALALAAVAVLWRCAAGPLPADPRVVSDLLAAETCAAGGSCSAGGVDRLGRASGGLWAATAAATRALGGGGRALAALGALLALLGVGMVAAAAAGVSGRAAAPLAGVWAAAVLPRVLGPGPSPAGLVALTQALVAVGIVAYAHRGGAWLAALLGCAVALALDTRPDLLSLPLGAAAGVVLLGRRPLRDLTVALGAAVAGLALVAPGLLGALATAASPRLWASVAVGAVIAGAAALRLRARTSAEPARVVLALLALPAVTWGLAALTSASPPGLGPLPAAVPGLALLLAAAGVRHRAAAAGLAAAALAVALLWPVRARPDGWRLADGAALAAQSGLSFPDAMTALAAPGCWALASTLALVPAARRSEPSPGRARVVLPGSADRAGLAAAGFAFVALEGARGAWVADRPAWVSRSVGRACPPHRTDAAACWELRWPPTRTDGAPPRLVGPAGTRADRARGRRASASGRSALRRRVRVANRRGRGPARGARRGGRADHAHARGRHRHRGPGRRVRGPDLSRPDLDPVGTPVPPRDPPRGGGIARVGGPVTVVVAVAALLIGGAPEPSASPVLTPETATAFQALVRDVAERRPLGPEQLVVGVEIRATAVALSLGPAEGRETRVVRLLPPPGPAAGWSAPWFQVQAPPQLRAALEVLLRRHLTHSPWRAPVTPPDAPVAARAGATRGFGRTVLVLVLAVLAMAVAAAGFLRALRSPR